MLRDQIISFLKDNPNPKDAELHAWAEKNKFDVHEVETEIYELATKFVNKSTIDGGQVMFSIIAKLHDYAEILEDKYNRADLSEILDKVASEIVAKYRFRIKRPRKGRGTTRTKRKMYYKQRRQKMRVKMRRYRMLHRTQLSRRRKLRHYHRFG
jgi:hypothetical protein